MDTKKKIIHELVALCLAISAVLPVFGQNVKRIKFCDKKYEYGVGKDSLTLYFNVLDANGKRIQNIATELLQDYLVIKEEGSLIPPSSCKISSITTGQRIPAEYTFSVLVDLSIPQEGKSQIYKAISQLVDISPKGCVYLSFFGDEVTSSQLVTPENLESFKSGFEKNLNINTFTGLCSQN